MAEVVIVNPFLHPDIVVHLADDQTIVEDRVTVAGSHDMRLGAGAYTASAFQRLGWHVEMVDAIGDDTLGEYTFRAAQSAGIGTRHLSRYAGRHMFVLSVADRKSAGGTMISSCPPEWQRSADEIRSSILAAPHADAYYIWSWFWSYANANLRSIAIDEVMASIRSKGGLVAVDPNWKPPGAPPAEEIDRLLESLASIDILKLNARDAEAIVGPKDARSSVLELLALGPSLVVLTLGRDGCAVGSADLPGVRRIVPDASAPRDTTGAGDAFGGFLVAEYSTHGDPMRAAAAATARTQAFLSRDGESEISQQQLDRAVTSLQERSTTL